MLRIFENIIGIPINIGTLGFWRIVKIASHHTMVDNNNGCNKVIKASYSEFKKAFEKVDWKINNTFEESLFEKDFFEKDCGDEFHANIIRINKVGYKLTTYGLMRAIKLVNKKIKEIKE
jgi:hypothetical protein